MGARYYLPQTNKPTSPNGLYVPTLGQKTHVAFFFSENQSCFRQNTLGEVNNNHIYYPLNSNFKSDSHDCMRNFWPSPRTARQAYQPILQLNVDCQIGRFDEWRGLCRRKRGNNTNWNDSSSNLFGKCSWYVCLQGFGCRPSTTTSDNWNLEMNLSILIYYAMIFSWKGQQFIKPILNAKLKFPMRAEVLAGAWNWLWEIWC